MCRTLFLVILLFSKFAFCDSLPPMTHHVERDVLITNIDDYTDLAIVAYIGAHYGDLAYVVKENERLDIGYKFNEFRLYGFNLSFIESHGGVEALDLDTLPSLIEGAQVPSPWGTVVDDSIPLVKETYLYRITEATRDLIRLRLWRRILEYSDARGEVIEEY